MLKKGIINVEMKMNAPSAKDPARGVILVAVVCTKTINTIADRYLAWYICRRTKIKSAREGYEKTRVRESKKCQLLREG